MNDESRPQAAPETPAKKSSASLARYSDTDPELAQRAGGVLRLTIRRDVEAECSACGATFGNTGAAASHARARRHSVIVHYASSFTFFPAELVGGVR